MSLAFDGFDLCLALCCLSLPVWRAGPVVLWNPLPLSDLTISLFDLAMMKRRVDGDWM